MDRALSPKSGISIKRGLAILTLVMAGGLVGCTNERVVADIPSAAYTASEVSYAGGDRDFWVIVQGNPFTVDQQQLDQAVTDRMRNRILGMRTNFTTAPNETARKLYRVVFVFNPSENTLKSELCSRERIPTLPPGGPIVLLGAFCRGTGALTTATGWLDRPQGLSDDDFRHLISDMTYSLFPNERAEVDVEIP